MTSNSLRERFPVATWVVATTFILSLVGIGISIYLTIVHYNAAVHISCPNTGIINCADVISGPYSSAFGIPFAVLGLLFWTGMAVLCSPWAWARPELFVHQVRLFGSVTGVLFVGYLVWIEFGIKHHICLWCTSIHVLAFVLFYLLITNRVAVLDDASQ